ncbi:MAG: LuxR C-terminal-related transcriptional regulator [Paludibacter sp.]
MNNSNQNYHELIHRFQKVSHEDYNRFERKKQVLLQLSKASNKGMAIYDMHLNEYTLLHWQHDTDYPFHNKFNCMESLQALLHPDDVEYVHNTKYKALSMLHELSVDDLKHHKLIYECRMKNNNGSYQRFLHQYMILELDKDGELWLLLLLLDPVTGKETETPPRGMMIMDCMTGTIKVSHTETCFTRREVEILQLLSRGYESIQIAEKLFISKNTVDNHRRNILSKTQTENTTQTLMYARIIGVI